MPKNAKRVAKPPAKPRVGAMSPAGLFSAMLGGLPAQVRLAAREQQQRPPAFVPKGKRGRRGR
jgi:hypothetical protein